MSDLHRSPWILSITDRQATADGSCPESVAVPPSRRRLLTGLVAAVVAVWPGRAPAGAILKWRCCGAICVVSGPEGDTTNCIHTCVKVNAVCPVGDLPPGCTLDCDEVVRNCGKCGKSICPARE
jgi:hypothetical protein